MLPGTPSEREELYEKLKSLQRGGGPVGVSSDGQTELYMIAVLCDTALAKLSKPGYAAVPFIRMKAKQVLS